MTLLCACSGAGEPRHQPDSAPTRGGTGVAPPWAVNYPATLAELVQPASAGEHFVAVVTAQDKCLAARGVDGATEHGGAKPSTVQKIADALMTGDRDFLARWGYGISTLLADPGFAEEFGRYTNPVHELLNTLDPGRAEYADASRLADACLRQALVEVDGVAATTEYVAARSSLASDLERDPTYRQLVRDWSGCAGNPGYEPATARDFMAERAERAKESGDADTPARAERELAVRDFDCRDQVNFTERLRTLGAPYVDQLRQRSAAMAPTASRVDLNDDHGIT